MTIAMCYMSPEGIVLGADSTSSVVTSDGHFHFFNHNQKLFEIGIDSTLAALTWGLGSLSTVSHRTLLGRLADDLNQTKPSHMQDVITRWTDLFWAAYSTDPDLLILNTECQTLGVKSAFDSTVSPANPLARTEAEEKRYNDLTHILYVGFCLAGYVLPNRTPDAYYVNFEAIKPKPVPVQIPLHAYGFWGAPNMAKRLIWGFDEELEKSITDSNMWTGSTADLRSILEKRRLTHAVLPIRDAVDFVHTCIYSTIKAMKFSQNAQICGGPIELAVLTTDRPFRWVRHKDWDAAIMEGERA
jgi:hypothetical protein